jgi:hypothetical protein
VYVPSSELGLSLPLSRQRVCPFPPNQKGGHNRLWVRGWVSPNSNDWRKSLALCLLCGYQYLALRVDQLMETEGQGEVGGQLYVYM